MLSKCSSIVVVIMFSNCVIVVVMLSNCVSLFARLPNCAFRQSIVINRLNVLPVVTRGT